MIGILVLEQPYDNPNARDATLKIMGKLISNKPQQSTERRETYAYSLWCTVVITGCFA